MSTSPPDPLAPFVPVGHRRAAPVFQRKPEEAATAALEVPIGYRAYAVASGPTRPLRLEMRPSEGGIAILRPYSSILEIAYDRAGYTGIWLTFPQVKFAILGSGLKPVIEALAAGTCEWIAEAADGESAPPGQPVITQIADQPNLPARTAPKATTERPQAENARPQRAT